ncbi:MAG: SufD family Fe-S cluster assembly protein, partial [Terrimicrobiaceae bacterium]|nr:SufD family Fe-S cluster assembly protein [Terrimicrobiaceae bacterium]
NLILSDEADPNSMPGLEILNDDVRCTHGATNGPISEEELFYLQARGIRREAASRLIVNGFFNSLLEKIPDLELREYVGKLVAHRLSVSRV